MDIQKAQRLSRYLGVISDMVEYRDISSSLINSGMLTQDENQTLLRKLELQGNVIVMQELLTIVNLRRGGFDILLNILRDTDYVWVAEQLDPGKALTESFCSFNRNEKRNTIVRSLITNVQKITRKSEPTISTTFDETNSIFTSYRESCPIDIPINPSFYTDTQRNEEDSKMNDGSSSPTLSSSEINLNAETEQSAGTNSLLTKLQLGTDSAKQAIIYNVVPDQVQNSTKYFSELAKRVNVPSPMVKNLKVIRMGKISKAKTKKTAVKLKFNSECGRNRFVDNLKEFISTLEPTDALYNSVGQLEVAVPTENKKRLLSKRFVKIGKSTRRSPTTVQAATVSSNKGKSSSHHWYQKPFKSWRK
ncbi:hypothetical protein Ocin01_04783 [Orchesella cincta]|uniref:CARD domain-containing protein n=1 Tax=Orchesella cincta TaxID=48709 RepID=A0A1D2N9H9_ORCCI|nr:hypothetical protein Ocin01_04783 [Orchesella cincta]